MIQLTPSGNFEMKSALIYLLLIIPFYLTSCKKKDDNKTYYDAKACFHVSPEKVYVDSVTTFSNCSDSAEVTYLWNFGDGSISSIRNPSHIFRNYGKYRVSLLVFVDGIKTDSTSQEIQVFIGEKYFDFLNVSYCTDFAEGNDSSVLVLGSTSTYPEIRCFLSKHDKNLRLKWIKYMATNNPLRSIERNTDGSFIISGNMGNSVEKGYSLTKIDSAGNVLWVKTYPEITGVSHYTCETVAGGFISIGSEEYHHESGNIIPIVCLVKTDVNGNFEWKKLFVNEWLMDANNLVITYDSYIFASSTRGRTGFLNDHDSLIITNVDFDGNIIWKKGVAWQLPNSGIIYSVWESRIMKTDSKIVALNDGNHFVMVFDSDGNFIERKLSGIEKNRFICQTRINSFIIGGGDSSWERIRLIGLSPTFDQTWSKSYFNVNSNLTYGFCMNGKVIFDGNFLIAGTKYTQLGSFNFGSLFLIKVNDVGEVQ